MKIKPLKNGRRAERKAGSGRWKNEKLEEITGGDRTIAYKTTLTYYVVKDGKEEKTCWSMHEYRLHREKSERQMRDDIVFCKIYKRGRAGKTSEAVDEETDGSIGSCSSPQSSTTVSNGLGLISFPDGHSLECSETEDLPTPVNDSSDFPLASLNNPYQFAVSPIEDSVTHKNIVYGGFPMADVNDPFQLEESPMEDSVTLMNGCGDFTMADANDPFQFERLPPIEHLTTLMNGCGDFTMADANDPFQFERLPPIEHLAALMNGWGDFTMADANNPFQFEESPIEDSVTHMNTCGDFSMADVNDPFQFERPPPIEHLAALMNGCGDFTMADVNDPFQFERLLLIEHSAALINGWGDFTVADANEHAIQF